MVVDVGGVFVGVVLFEFVFVGVFEVGGGGGFMLVGVGEGFDIGLGREDKGFFVDDVLIVICLVVGGDE